MIDKIFNFILSILVFLFFGALMATIGYFVGFLPAIVQGHQCYFMSFSTQEAGAIAGFIFFLFLHFGA